MQQNLYEEEHQLFRESVRAFLKKEAVPYYETWEKEGKVDRALWKKAADLGLLGIDIPEEYTGLGLNDFRYNAILLEELGRANSSGPGFSIQNEIVVPYLNKYCTPAQKQKYFPKIVSGDIICALGMSEPAAGSDLKGIRTTAIKKSGHYLLNGAKTFIGNGIHADLVVLFVKTNPELGNKGFSLFLLERGMEGFTRGKKLDKIGMKGQDTAELFFEDVKVPFDNLLGEEGRGFYYLMHNLPQERLGIAINAIANTEAMLAETIQYCKDRKAFGRSIGTFQNSRFAIAEMQTEVTISRTFVDACIQELCMKTLTAEKAAMAKYWVTDLQFKIIDQCLQLHGGYGYMNEFNVARAWRDCRVQRIYGGTNEIMKEIIGRSIGF